MFDSYGVESPNYLDAEVMLSDYGTGSSSFYSRPGSPSDPPKSLATPRQGDHRREIQPIALRCPEALIGCEWTTKADIWNLGCLVCIAFLLLPLIIPSIFLRRLALVSFLYNP